MPTLEFWRNQRAVYNAVCILCLVVLLIYDLLRWIGYRIFSEIRAFTCSYIKVFWRLEPPEV